MTIAESPDVYRVVVEAAVAVVFVLREPFVGDTTDAAFLAAARWRRKESISSSSSWVIAKRKAERGAVGSGQPTTSSQYIFPKQAGGRLIGQPSRSR